MRVVLDTNVVVSALLWGGTPLRLIQAATEGTITLCTSDALLVELGRVLSRQAMVARLGQRQSSAEKTIGFYRGRC